MVNKNNSKLFASDEKTPLCLHFLEELTKGNKNSVFKHTKSSNFNTTKYLVSDFYKPISRIFNIKNENDQI